MAQQILVKIDYRELLPTEVRYVATINNENYKIVVSADSIANCFKELSKSIFVADAYQKPNK